MHFWFNSSHPLPYMLEHSTMRFICPWCQVWKFFPYSNLIGLKKIVSNCKYSHIYSSNLFTYPFVAVYSFILVSSLPIGIIFTFAWATIPFTVFHSASLLEIHFLHFCLKVKSLSRVRLFVTPWTVAYHGSSVHGIFRARVLEWVVTSSSKESSQSRDQTHISCVSSIGRQILYYCSTWEAGALM